MATKWLVFDSLTKSGSGWGTKGQTGYGGIVSFLGSIIGGLKEGGVTGPLLAHYPVYSYAYGGIAKIPQIGIFGEGGGSGEAFVPLKNGKIPVETKGSGDTYTYYIDARGSQRGVSAEITRAIRESENRAVIRSVNKVADSKLRGGKFAKIFKD